MIEIGYISSIVEAYRNNNILTKEDGVTKVVNPKLDMMKVRGFRTEYNIEQDIDVFKVLLKNDMHESLLFNMYLPAASEVSVLIERLEGLIAKLKEVDGGEL